MLACGGRTELEGPGDGSRLLGLCRPRCRQWNMTIPARHLGPLDGRLSTRARQRRAGSNSAFIANLFVVLVGDRRVVAALIAALIFCALFIGWTYYPLGLPGQASLRI